MNSTSQAVMTTDKIWITNPDEILFKIHILACLHFDGWQQFYFKCIQINAAMCKPIPQEASALAIHLLGDWLHYPQCIGH